MMTRSKMLCARAGAAAIIAVLALSPIHASIKPIVDLSKSPAVSGKTEASPPAKPATKAKQKIGPFDEQTAELGGGAIALLALGGGAFALSRRKRREESQWEQEATVSAGARDPLFDEPMFQDEPQSSGPSAFAWDKAPRLEETANGRREGETWVERARRGPTPENPSLSLKTRLKRAAFFDRREREAAAGKAVPVDADAGLPEAMVDENEFETA